MIYCKVDSEQTAKKLSELLYSIMYPANVFTETQYLFGWVEYNGFWYCEIPENYECPVFIKDNFESVIQQIEQTIGFAFAEGEGALLVEKLKTGKIILEEIIPSGIEKASIIKESIKLPLNGNLQ